MMADSRFLSAHAGSLEPYTPGEQPRDGTSYIKLNTNECPYPPAPGVLRAIEAHGAEALRLYPDPDSGELLDALAALHGVKPENLFPGNGSDEVLAFSFLAFFDRGDGVCFPDITYSFYKVYAQLCGLKPALLPLDEMFRIPPGALRGLPGHLYLANPNAPTALAIGRGAIETALRENPDRLIVVDEAYADYADHPDGPVSAVPLVDSFDNLLVVRTFSKSHSLAGLRVGYAVGCEALIRALNRVKNSFNSYTVDRLANTAAAAAAKDVVYWRRTVDKVKATRQRTAAALRERGYLLTDSDANFLFVRKPGFSGRALYEGLRARGVLVRHFPGERTGEYLRVTVGTDAEMDRLLAELDALDFGETKEGTSVKENEFMRAASCERETAETAIKLHLNLDGRGDYAVSTGVGFFDHMLEQFARHGRFDLQVECEGDTRVDAHHTVEDVGIALGRALTLALGEKRGIRRYGSFLLPMDEAMVLVALDLSGRSTLAAELDIPAERIGSMDSELVEEFLLALSRSASMTLHVRQLAGKNSHHIAEAVFKALGRALREAVSLEAGFEGEIPSTKGVL